MEQNYEADTIIIDKIKNTILYSIYGDTFGVPFELWSPEFIKKKINEIFNKEDYIIHNNNKIINKLVKTHKNNFIGEYSDDSEMILATMDSIINNCGISNNLLETFKKYYSCERGYGINTGKILSGEIINTISTSNGGLMRICPVAIWNFYSDSCDLERDIINDLKLTNHNSIESIQTCLFFSKIIIYFLNLNKPCEIQDFISFITDIISELNIIKEPILLIINNFLKNNDALELEIINKLEIYTTDCVVSIQKVLNAFLFHYNEPDMIIPYINSYGGDTDTHCNLIGSLIGARFGTLNNNVEFDKIENIENIYKLTNKFTNIVMERYKNLKDIKNINIETTYIGL